ncbi:uncharacterized protein [Cherax quadricarinatus]
MDRKEHNVSDSEEEDAGDLHSSDKNHITSLVSEVDPPEALPVIEDGKKILSKVIADFDEYNQVGEPGALQNEDLDSDTELYLFVIPSELINPYSLINKEVVIGSSKGKDLIVEEQHCRIVTYENSSVADTPTLFLPDEMGMLHIANSEIKGQVLIRSQPRNLVSQPKINIDDLRSVQHKPPADIKERNFLSNAGNVARKRTVVEENDGELTQVSKRKKKKKFGSQHSNDVSQIEEAEATGVDFSLDAAVMHKNKDKKSRHKKCKKSHQDSSVDNDYESDDMFLDLPTKKKKKKKKKKSKKLDNTM